MLFPIVTTTWNLQCQLNLNMARQIIARNLLTSLKLFNIEVSLTRNFLTRNVSDDFQNFSNISFSRKSNDCTVENIPQKLLLDVNFITLNRHTPLHTYFTLKILHESYLSTHKSHFIILNRHTSYACRLKSRYTYFWERT